MHGPPVLDLGPVVQRWGRSELPSGAAENTAELRSCVAQVSAACAEWGFFQVQNHGIPEVTLREFDAQMRAFFALSKEAKNTIKRSDSNSKFGSRTSFSS